MCIYGCESKKGCLRDVPPSRLIRRTRWVEHRWYISLINDSNARYATCIPYNYTLLCNASKTLMHNVLYERCWFFLHFFFVKKSRKSLQLCTTRLHFLRIQIEIRCVNINFVFCTLGRCERSILKIENLMLARNNSLASIHVL